jgi:integrase/recombinase XerD
MKLHAALEQYITLKKSLGFRFETARRILMAFGRALGEVNMGEVEPTAVRAYLDGDGPVTRTWALRWRTLRCFYRFAQARRWVRRSPLPQAAPKVTDSFTPYIYTTEELRGLLNAITPARAAGLTPSTVRALLLLLYGAGLRISEALQLGDGDVDLKDRLVHVRCSKFYKARLVPIGPRLAQELREYASKRPETSGSHQRFFRTKRGAPISCCAADRIFRTVRAAAGISRNDGAYCQPRLHDLRHTAAVHRLVAAYRKGVDLQAVLVGLSVYLGHADLHATQRYLTVTPELRGKACKRFARYALGGSHE